MGAGALSGRPPATHLARRRARGRHGCRHPCWARLSSDADHVLTDLKQRFDTVLAELESVAGWTTARVTRPVQILGSLDGIETGGRRLIRQRPLETQRLDTPGGTITVPPLQKSCASRAC